MSRRAGDLAAPAGVILFIQFLHGAALMLPRACLPMATYFAGLLQAERHLGACPWPAYIPKARALGILRMSRDKTVHWHGLCTKRGHVSTR